MQMSLDEHPGPLADLIQALADAQDKRYSYRVITDGVYEFCLCGSDFKYRVEIQDDIMEQYFERIEGKGGIVIEDGSVKQ